MKEKCITCSLNNDKLFLMNYSDNKDVPHFPSKKHKNAIFKVCICLYYDGYVSAFIVVFVCGHRYMWVIDTTTCLNPRDSV